MTAARIAARPSACTHTHLRIRGHASRRTQTHSRARATKDDHGAAASTGQRRDQQNYGRDNSAVALGPAVALALVTTLVATDAAHAADVAHHHASATSAVPLFDIASNDDFWDNTARFVRYFFSVLLGTAYVALKPVWDAIKKGPVSAVGTLGGIALAIYVIYAILQTMLVAADVGLTPNYTYMGGEFTGL
ncbi:DUF751 domain-containing protein [Pycnococcus provasolii]